MIASISGGNPVYLINPTEGKKDSVILLLNNSKGLKAWKKSEVPAKWHYGTNPRIPEIVVVADSSWSIGTGPDGSSLKEELMVMIITTPICFQFFMLRVLHSKRTINSKS